MIYFVGLKGGGEAVAFSAKDRGELAKMARQKVQRPILGMATARGLLMEHARVSPEDIEGDGEAEGVGWVVDLADAYGRDTPLFSSYFVEGREDWGPEPIDGDRAVAEALGHDFARREVCRSEAEAADLLGRLEKEGGAARASAGMLREELGRG